MLFFFFSVHPSFFPALSLSLTLSLSLKDAHTRTNAVGKYRDQKWKYSLFHQRHALLTSFGIFVVTPTEWPTLCQNWWACHYFVRNKLNFHLSKLYFIKLSTQRTELELAWNFCDCSAGIVRVFFILRQNLLRVFIALLDPPFVSCHQNFHWQDICEGLKLNVSSWSIQTYSLTQSYCRVCTWWMISFVAFLTAIKWGYQVFLMQNHRAFQCDKWTPPSPECIAANPIFILQTRRTMVAFSVLTWHLNLTRFVVHPPPPIHFIQTIDSLSTKRNFRYGT